ncbi:MAG TPA: ABC transporter, partial [Verrucomicrobiales bacterium]|nr:ABC transporter [Verrucomicrobiales bacterium]
EPTGNLDAGTGAGVMDMLMGVVGEAGKTLVVVTHDLALAKRGDRLLRLKDGGLVPG